MEDDDPTELLRDRVWNIDTNEQAASERQSGTGSHSCRSGVRSSVVSWSITRCIGIDAVGMSAPYSKLWSRRGDSNSRSRAWHVPSTRLGHSPIWWTVREWNSHFTSAGPASKPLPARFMGRRRRSMSCLIAGRTYAVPSRGAISTPGPDHECFELRL
jgi:hypothetical protein